MTLASDKAKNTRRKGLAGVREVRKILEANGSRVEGPGYQPLFVKKMIVVHRDYFGIFDLISLDVDGVLHGHQVTTSPDHKAEKIREMIEAKVAGTVWVKYPKKKIGSQSTSGWRAWYVFLNGEVADPQEPTPTVSP